MTPPSPPPEWLKEWATVAAKLAALGAFLLAVFRYVTGCLVRA